MLQQIDNGLWVDEVPFKLLGIDFGNRMTCIQLSDHSLWLHSPVKYSQETYDKLSSMGQIKYLVAPSLMHNLFIMDWKQKDFTQVLAPANIKKVKPDQMLNSMSDERLSQLFNEEIGCIPVDGIPALQEFVFIHHASKTLILTDLAFNFGNESKGWSGFFLKLYGAHDKFGPTITIRALIKDKQAFGKSLHKILKHDFDRVIVSHGRIVENDGKAKFEKAFNKYLALNKTPAA